MKKYLVRAQEDLLTYGNVSTYQVHTDGTLNILKEGIQVATFAVGQWNYITENTENKES